MVPATPLLVLGYCFLSFQGNSNLRFQIDKIDARSRRVADIIIFQVVDDLLFDHQCNSYRQSEGDAEKVPPQHQVLRF